MQLQKTEWAERFGVCMDRFGVHWMLTFTGAKPLRFARLRAV